LQDHFTTTLSDNDALKKLIFFTRKKILFPEIEEEIRRLCKKGEQDLLFNKEVDGKSLPVVAAESLNVPVLRELFLQGLEPDRVLIPHGPLFETLFNHSLIESKNLDGNSEKSESKIILVQIAQLCWIHKAVIHIDKPFQPSSEYLKNQRQELLKLFPTVFNFHRLDLLFCYAVHSALLEQNAGSDRGKILLTAMIKKLPVNCIQVLELVCKELQHTENYRNQKLKVSLKTNHFQCDLLRAIQLDDDLLSLLNLPKLSLENFNRDLRTREQFREQLINCLVGLVAQSNSMHTLKFTYSFN
jgi:hypothetical protein